MGVLRWLSRWLSRSGLRVSLTIAVGVFGYHLVSELRLLRGAAPTFLQLLELTALDVKLAWRGPQRPPSWGVTVVAADERAIQRLGRLPWSRSVHARIVEALTGLGAGTIAFDMTFEAPAVTPGVPVEGLRGVLASLDRTEAALPPGPESADAERALAEVRTTLAREVERLARTASVAEEDSALAGALTRSGRVLLGLMARSTDEAQDIAPEAIVASLEQIEPSLIVELVEEAGGFTRPIEDSSVAIERALVPRFAGLIAPTATLAASARGFGLINALPDVDGVYRRVPLLGAIRGVPVLVPTLALSAVAEATHTPIEVLADPLTGQPVEVRVAEHHFELELGGTSALDWYGPFEPTNMPIVSAAELLAGTVPREMVEGRVVFVAATAVGTFDQRVTPFGSSVPGVAVQATLAQNLLEGRQLLRPRWVVFLELGALLVLGLVLGLGLSRVGPFWQIGLAVLVALGWLAFDATVLFRAGWWVSTVVPLAQVGITLVALVSWRFLVEERERRQTRRAFSRYLSPRVLEKVLEHPEEFLKLGGRRAEATVIFSDIRGFTTLSEQLSPEALGHLLNLYLTPMTELVLEGGGTLDKFIGDAVMAFWGAPIPQPDHALRAARTAIAMLRRVDQLNGRLVADGLPPIAIGIGLSSGPMTIGNMGSEGLFAYTAIGDRVNLGARLEGQTKEYGVSAIMAEATWRAVQDDVAWRELGSLRVKGKTEPVRIFELIGTEPLSGTRKAFVDHFHAGLAAFRRQDWDGADAGFEAALALAPDDRSARAYREEIDELRRAPPPSDWDGTRTAKGK